VLRALLLASAAGLVLVFVMPEVNGAHRWIRYGRASFQPSEIAKLVLLIYVADYLHRHEAEINQFMTTLLPCTAVLLFHCPQIRPIAICAPMGEP
jgi:cell division protein FtsW